METARSLGGFIAAGFVGLGAWFIGAFIFTGTLAVAEQVYPVVAAASAIGLVLAGLAGLPMLAFRATRTTAGVGLFLLSFLFGGSLWLASIILVAEAWGIPGLIVGVVFAGVGFVPLAAIASVLNGDWLVLAQIIGLAVVTFGARMGGLAAADAFREEPATRVAV